MTNTRRVTQSGQSLEALGLTTVEAEVFTVLVRHPHSSAPEIAEAAAMAPDAVGDALTGLVAAGLATRTAGPVAGYVAAAPDATLGSMMARAEGELRRARDEIDRLTAVHREATRFTHPSDLVEVLRGNATIAARLMQVQDAARHQVRGFDKPPYVADPPHNFAPQAARLSDGVRYRTVYDREAMAWPGYLDGVILPLQRLGEQPRVVADLPMKLFLVDEDTAIIPITSSEHVADAAYVVHPCALLDALIELFELLWARATPVGAAQADGNGEEHGRLLALLASGATDAGIARATGWSMRTAQRRIRALLDELEVTTRFQAGIAARERGWI